MSKFLTLIRAKEARQHIGPQAAIEVAEAFTSCVDVAKYLQCRRSAMQLYFGSSRIGRQHNMSQKQLQRPSSSPMALQFPAVGQSHCAAYRPIWVRHNRS